MEVPLDLKRVDIIKDRFLTLASCMPMKDFLSGWFQGADADTVLRGNVADFIAYGFYCRKLDELTPEVSIRSSLAELFPFCCRSSCCCSVNKADH